MWLKKLSTVSIAPWNLLLAIGLDVILSSVYDNRSFLSIDHQSSKP